MLLKTVQSCMHAYVQAPAEMVIRATTVAGCRIRLHSTLLSMTQLNLIHINTVTSICLLYTARHGQHNRQSTYRKLVTGNIIGCGIHLGNRHCVVAGEGFSNLNKQQTYVMACKDLKTLIETLSNGPAKDMSGTAPCRLLLEGTEIHCAKKPTMNRSLGWQGLLVYQLWLQHSFNTHSVWWSATTKCCW